MRRNCFCTLWQTKPEALTSQGIPDSYCGICERCGKPGHMSHYPGPVPYTGAWCDRCYRIVAWTWPFRIPVLRIIYVSLGCGLAYSLFRTVAR